MSDLRKLGSLAWQYSLLALLYGVACGVLF
jgi:uncharacterized membrane-anchored protein YhcB (DUF1043 family)